MVRLICGWCREEFRAEIKKDKHGDRNTLICPYCRRTLPSSRKVPSDSVNKKHIHIEYKDGDIAG